MKVYIRLIDGGKAPSYKRDGDACLDCCARIDGGGMTVIPSGARAYISLGFMIEIPNGYKGKICPRSGNTGAGIDIGLGTLDPNFRGEVKACVINNSPNPFIIDNGDRICQLAIEEAIHIEIEKMDELSKTERGEAGFGSSGVK